MDHSPDKPEREEKPEFAEAVCFTAGPQGAAFGAGVIHAWLVSDRREPRVVSGISTGSITAAAMQRTMLERGPLAGRTEEKRWGWFQGYLTDILDKPLDVIWKSVPDPVDFFSATMPVRDLSCPPELKEDERRSRYHFWTLIKVGNWAASLPVSIGEVGTLAILKVRRDERIPIPVLGSGTAARMWRGATFSIQFVSIAAQILHKVIWNPSFIRTREQFVYDELKLDAGFTKRKLSEAENSAFQTSLCAAGVQHQGRRLGSRPLFGWSAWLSACGVAALVAVFAATVIGCLALALHWFSSARAVWGGAALLSAMLLVALSAVALARLFKTKTFAEKLEEMAGRVKQDGAIAPECKSGLAINLYRSVLRAADVELSIISNYQLKRRIWNRFSDPENKDFLKVRCSGGPESNLVVVASVLQSLAGINQQSWARHGSSLLNALTTACAMQQIFPPTHLTGEQAQEWLREKDLKAFRDKHGKVTQQFDLIDGGAIRKNPLPALFNWFQENPEAAHALQSDSQSDARIHVIYGIPIEPFDAYAGKRRPDRIDLIESAQVGILMRARRDTSIEVRQTNYLSQIVVAEKGLGVEPGKLLTVFADEIGPARELTFSNPLSPTREEGLASVAEGCRRTLGRLYAKELQDKESKSGPVLCSAFIKEIAPWRAKEPHAAGLPEVCAHCTGMLTPYLQPPIIPKIVHPDFAGRAEESLGNLIGKDAPKIAFVASGGVFRGAFHIGLIGALQALEITPDLVVGASVGTLMGGALAAIRNSRGVEEQLRLLARLSDTFLHVDDKVALTVPLKAAVKRLGLRARQLKLSPARLREIVRAGTAEDIGYAATGVPPIVIDTLSQLFIIPPKDTIRVGSDFLGGRFAKAASNLSSLIRKNTLDSLEIRYAVIGTSLLEGVARLLLGGTKQDFELNRSQPYVRDEQGKRVGTAIFCTTAWVNQRWLLVLGRDALQAAMQPFHFLYAALSSSAFPAAFPARKEAEVFPGAGSDFNLFCDGGTFDNLPFMPTIDLLHAAQVKRFRRSGVTALEFLTRQLQAPDLIISAGFDPVPANDRRQYFDLQNDVAARASSLGSSVKTESFVSMSMRVRERLSKLAEAMKGREDTLPKGLAEIVTGAVVAGVVNVAPTSELHVNPTFGFSQSVGLRQERVAASIADGCFQTLLNLRQRKWAESSEVGLSLRALGIDVEIGASKATGGCPYFVITCPFYAAAQVTDGSDCLSVYTACGTDAVHKKLIQIG